MVCDLTTATPVEFGTEPYSCCDKGYWCPGKIGGYGAWPDNRAIYQPVDTQAVDPHCDCFCNGPVGCMSQHLALELTTANVR